LLFKSSAQLDRHCDAVSASRDITAAGRGCFAQPSDESFSVFFALAIWLAVLDSAGNREAVVENRPSAMPRHRSRAKWN
jgi:hypothetical protein